MNKLSVRKVAAHDHRCGVPESFKLIVNTEVVQLQLLNVVRESNISLSEPVLTIGSSIARWERAG